MVIDCNWWMGQQAFSGQVAGSYGIEGVADAKDAASTGSKVRSVCIEELGLN